MRQLLPLVLLPLALASCNSFSPYVVQGVTVEVTGAVLAACDSVTWAEPALTWKDDSTLGPGLSFKLTDAAGNPLTPTNSVLVNKTIVMSQVGQYVIYNANSTSLGKLNSTFTCTKTGQSITAATTLQTIRNSAGTTISLKDGQIAAVWSVF